MSNVNQAIEAAREAQNFSDVVGALYSADLSALADAYIDVSESLLSAARDGMTAQSAATVRQAYRVAHAGLGIGFGSRAIRLEKAIMSAMAAADMDDYGVQTRGAWIVLGELVSMFLSIAFIDETPRDDPEAIKAAAQRALDWLDDAVSGEGQVLHDDVTRPFKRDTASRLERAERDKLLAVVGSIGPAEGPSALNAVTEAIKHATTGMTPDQQANFMARTGMEMLRQASDKIAVELVKEVGADKLPDWAAELARKAAPDEVVVGKLRAAGADEFKRLYAGRVNEAKKLLRPAIQNMLDDQYRQAVRELEASIPDMTELRRAIDQRRNELVREANADFEQMAHEAVSQQAGVTPEELGSALERVERVAADFEAERVAVGQRLLAEISERLALPGGEAVKLRAGKVKILPSAAKLLGPGHDQSIDRLLRLVGGGLRSAGAVEVMSVSDVKKRHPDKYSGRGVKRAFCARGDRFTLDGAEDRAVIGLGTTSGDTQTLWHEVGHWLEHNNPLVAAMAAQWKARRTAGEKPVRLVDLFPNASYQRDEITLRDNFIHPYIGKVYRTIGTTEVVSMGLEYLHDPKHAGILASKDPDMLSLMVKIIEVVNG